MFCCDFLSSNLIDPRLIYQVLIWLGRWKGTIPSQLNFLGQAGLVCNFLKDVSFFHIFKNKIELGSYAFHAFAMVNV